MRLAAAVVLLGAAAARADEAAPDAGCALEVTVDGLRAGGQVWTLVFDDPHVYPTKRDKALRRLDAEPADGGVSLRFESLACGRDYAVAVVHDENGNGRLDTYFFGAPREGLGASRDARGFLGPPRFDAAKLHLARGRLSVPIRIRY